MFYLSLPALENSDKFTPELFSIISEKKRMGILKRYLIA